MTETNEISTEEETMTAKPVKAKKKRPNAKKQALPGTRANLIMVDPDSLIIIGWDTKHKNKAEHTLWDKRANMAVNDELVENIILNGQVLENVIVRKNGDDAEVVVGRQRIKACRVANKKLVKDGKLPIRVPVVVTKGDDKKMFGVMMSENELRQDDDMLTKSENAVAMEEMGYTKDEIRVHFGFKSTVAVDNLLALACLHNDVRNGVRAGRISASAAAKLSGLKREEQVEQYEAMLESGATSTAEAARRTRNTKAPSKKGKKKVDDEEGGLQPPGKRDAKHVLKQCMEDGELMSTDFVDCLRWMLGDKSPRSIAGLSALLKK